METGVKVDAWYRTIFVVEPSRHDLSALNRYTDRIKFLTSGYDNREDIKNIMMEELSEFDPNLDAVVITGRLLSNLILGSLLSKFPVVIVGLFMGGDTKDYVFEEVNLDQSR